LVNVSKQVGILFIELDIFDEFHRKNIGLQSDLIEIFFMSTQEISCLGILSISISMMFVQICKQLYRIYMTKVAQINKKP